MQEQEMLWYCECGRAYDVRLEETTHEARLPRTMPVVIPETARVTDFEQRALACVAAGMTDKEVATHLGVSRNQVRYAMRSAITRLAARSRTEAVAVALTAGLIELSRAPSLLKST
jgi:DNA-binding CsgD family transcriptional regulator